jgi:hypothetical protein
MFLIEGLVVSDLTYPAHEALALIPRTLPKMNLIKMKM